MNHRMFGMMMLLFMFGTKTEAAERVAVTIENGIARTEVTDTETGEFTDIDYEPALLSGGAGRYEFRSDASEPVELTVEIKTAQTIGRIDAPHCANVHETENGSWVVECASIDPQAIAVEYQLAESPRGRVQLWAYRAAGAETGTFLLSLEPGQVELDAAAPVEFAGERVIESVQLGDARGLVVIGRYGEPGGVRMTARDAAGEAYAAAIELPDVDEDTPELERLWFTASGRELNESATESAVRLERERAAQAMRAQFIAWNAQIDLGRPMFGSPVPTETAVKSEGEHDSCGCLMVAIPGMSEKLEAEIDAIELIGATGEGF